MTTYNDLKAYLHTQEWVREQEEAWKEFPVPVDCGDGVRRWLDDVVPDTRAECPVERPCVHVCCPWHLWRVDDLDRGGRPWPGYGPRAFFNPVWKMNPIPNNCGLDLAQRAMDKSEGTPTEQIAKCMGRDDSLMRRIVRRALIKLRANGVSIEDMRALLNDG